MNNIDSVNNLNSEEKKQRRSPMILSRIFCLLIAVVIWLYVVNISSGDYEKTFTVDLSVEGVTELAQSMGMTVYDQAESRVSVVLSGKRNVISSVLEGDIRAFVDVSSIESSGRHTTAVKISAPSGVSVISYSPSSIDVMTDLITEVTVPVEIDLQKYSISSGYEIGAYSTDTNSVTVKGPAATLGKISKAKAVVDLGAGWITSSFRNSAELILVDADGIQINNPFLSCSVDSVDVDVSVLLRKNISLAVEYEAGFDSSKIQSVSINPSTLAVKGSAEILTDISKLVILKIGTDTKADTVIKIADLDLPEGIEYYGSADRVNVHIEYKPLVTEPPVTTPPETTSNPETTNTPSDTEASSVTEATEILSAE